MTMVMAKISKAKTRGVPFKLHAKGLVGTKVIQQEGSNQIIRVRVASTFGCEDDYPNPMAYVLSALIACYKITAQLVAKDLGAELFGFEFNLNIDGDATILVQGAKEGNPNFQNLQIRVVVETDISDELFEKFRLETERRFPISPLCYRSGVNLTSYWSIRRPNTPLFWWTD
jgi:putative redox protein